MDEIRILGLADTHVDERMTLGGMRPLTPTGRPRVLEDSRRLFAWVAETARIRQVHLLLHAGDLYERPRPSPAAHAVAAEGIDACVEVAPKVIVCGNHDRPRGRDDHALEPLRYRRPGRLCVVDTPTPLGVYLRDVRGSGIPDHFGVPDRAADVVVFPVPTLTRPYCETIAQGRAADVQWMTEHLNDVVAAHAEAARALSATPGGPATVLLGHGTLRGARFDDYQTAPIADPRISTDQFDAFTVPVWGHIHLRQSPPGCPGQHGYVGSADRHDFGEEHHAKGVSLITLRRANPCAPWTTEVEFIPYPGARVFRTIPAGDFLGWDDAGSPGPDATVTDIIRVVGEVSDGPDVDRIVGKIRDLQRSGWIVGNRVTVTRQSRARVVLDETNPQNLTLMGAVRAACTTRDDLLAHQGAILGCVAQLRAAATEDEGTEVVA